MPRLLSAVTIIDLGGIKLDIPDPGGLFSGGLLSGIGVIMQLAFGLTLVVWVVVSLLAGLKIMQSQGNPDKIQEGMTKIKYTWIAVSVVFVFFVIVSLVGAVFGYGTPIEWANTLAQCGGYDGPFYFSQTDQQIDLYNYKYGINAANSKVYCCLYTPGDTIDDEDFPFRKSNLTDMGIDSTRINSNWIVLGSDKLAVDSNDPNDPLTWNGNSNTGFSRCYVYAK